MKFLSALLFFNVLACFALSAKETEITGLVCDKADTSPIEFANVAALDGTGRIKSICATDEKGRFRLIVDDDGEYNIRFTFMGYVSQSRHVSCHGEPISLGSIALARSHEELSAAAISEKGLIRREADRIVYDVLADPDAAKMDMTAFMSKIPGLAKSDANGKLNYREKQIASIIVNDRTSSIINANRQYPMSFIKADYMSKIELVLPGSPEYNNTEPILVLTLSRDLPFGAAAQLSADAGTLNDYNVRPDAVANMPFIGIGVSYNFGYSRNPALYNLTERKTFPSGSSPGSLLTSSTQRRDESQSHVIHIDLFRSFWADKLDLSLSFGTETMRNEGFTKTNTVRTVGSSVSRDEFSSLGRGNSPFRLSAGAKASYRWSAKGSVNLQYTLKHKESSDTEYIDWFQGVSDRVNTKTNSSVEQNVEADILYRHSRALSVRSSAGYMYRDYENDAAYWNGMTGGMEYVQKVAYMRASLAGEWSKTRLRYALMANIENISNRGEKIPAGSLDYDEFNIIPRLHLAWRAWKSGSLLGGYSVRSSRPRQQMLDPAADFRDPDNVYVGNAGLRGEVSHMAELGMSQDFHGRCLESINLGLGYTIVTNAIERVSSVDASNIRTTTYMNIGSKDELAMNLGMRLKITKAVNLSVNASALKSSYVLPDGYANGYWMFRGMAQATTKLKFVTIMQNFNLSPSVADAQTRRYSLYPDWSINVIKYFERIKLGVNLYVKDILHGRTSTFAETAGEGFSNMAWTGKFGRSFGISVYWRIGKFKNLPSVEHSSYDL